MATICWQSTSSGFRGKRVDSMWPSCMALVTAAQATRSARYFGKGSFTHGVDVVPGAANPLHPAGDRWWSFNLDDEVDRAHVDAQFQSGGGAEGFDLAGLQLLLNDGTLIGGEGAVMCAGDRFAGEIIQGPGKAFGDLAAVDEKNGRRALPDQFEEARVNGVPDGGSDAEISRPGRKGFPPSFGAAPYLRPELQFLALTAWEQKHSRSLQDGTAVEYKTGVLVCRNNRMSCCSLVEAGTGSGRRTFGFED